MKPWTPKHPETAPYLRSPCVCAYAGGRSRVRYAPQGRRLARRAFGGGVAVVPMAGLVGAVFGTVGQNVARLSRGTVALGAREGPSDDA